MLLRFTSHSAPRNHFQTLSAAGLRRPGALTGSDPDRDQGGLSGKGACTGRGGGDPSWQASVWFPAKEHRDLSVRTGRAGPLAAAGSKFSISFYPYTVPPDLRGPAAPQSLGLGLCRETRFPSRAPQPFAGLCHTSYTLGPRCAKPVLTALGAFTLEPPVHTARPGAHALSWPPSPLLASQPGSPRAPQKAPGGCAAREKALLPPISWPGCRFG